VLIGKLRWEFGARLDSRLGTVIVALRRAISVAVKPHGVDGVGT
jgi:hypothetical protein